MKEKNLDSYNGRIRLGISVEDRKWAESDAQRKEILCHMPKETPTKSQ